jgi:hypothetical protein
VVAVSWYPFSNNTHLPDDLTQHSLSDVSKHWKKGRIEELLFKWVNIHQMSIIITPQKLTHRTITMLMPGVREITPFQRNQETIPSRM